jgi:transposase
MPKKFPPEVRDRAVRMTLDRLSEYPTMFAACKALACEVGCRGRDAPKVGGASPN